MSLDAYRVEFFETASQIPRFRRFQNSVLERSRPSHSGTSVGSPVLDEGRVGLVSHVNRRTALLSLQVALEKKADELRAPLIVWKDFPESSSADLNWLSHERRLFRVISFPNTIVEFPSHRKEDYFAAMKGSRRRNFEKEAETQ